MARELEGEKLDGWLEEAGACRVPAVRNFAASYRSPPRSRLPERSGAGKRAKPSSE